MSFGVSSFLFTSPFSTENEEIFARVASMGFEVFEMAVENSEIINSEKARKLLKKYGLKSVVCSVVGNSRNVASADHEIYKTADSYLRYCIDLAAEVGAKVVCGPFHSAVGFTELLSSGDKRERLLDRVVPRLNSLAEYADEKGVNLAIEPLNRFENSFINTTEQALELVKKVNHQAFGIHLDTFHMNIEEKDIPAAIREAGEYLFHFHICENDRGIPGSGHLPWQKIAIALKDINYKGDLVIESFTDRVKSIARAVSTWRKLAPSPEVIAGEGLKFLKRIF